MAGELSPDRLFYWDGTQWVSAVSADGAWRWNGVAWHPAPHPELSGRRQSGWLIAVLVTAAVFIASIGVYYAVGAASHVAQRFLVTTCGSHEAQPGVALRSGDTLCGARLGNELLLADCTVSSGAPAGINVSQRTSEDVWVHPTVTSSNEGCELAAQPNNVLSFDTSDVMPASQVVVVDFKVTAMAGILGVELACGDGQCIDASFFGYGLYRMDEEYGGDWTTLARGYSLSGPQPQGGQTSRMIFRLQGRNAFVFLNGSQVMDVHIAHDKPAGDDNFYLDNLHGLDLESVLLQRMYVFASP